MSINHFYAADDFTGEQCVLLSDHIASHAYDEAKERELFEISIKKIAVDRKYSFMSTLLLRDAFTKDYRTTWVDMAWLGWAECAKSRARSAE